MKLLWVGIGICVGVILGQLFGNFAAWWIVIGLLCAIEVAPLLLARRGEK